MGPRRHAGDGSWPFLASEYALTLAAGPVIPASLSGHFSPPEKTQDLDHRHSVEAVTTLTQGERRLGGANRGRGRRGAASEMDAPEVEGACVEVVLAGPISGRETGGVCGEKTSLGVPRIEDLARHRDEEWARARSPSSRRR
jgi:hypothetical protein